MLLANETQRRRDNELTARLLANGLSSGDVDASYGAQVTLSGCCSPSSH
jgi:hypothetical protein